MIYVEFCVEGVMPLLLHRMEDSDLTKGGIRSNTPADPDDPRNVAEKAAYRLPSGQVALPGTAFLRLMREAGANHKLKGMRKAAKSLVPAAVIVLDDLCGLCLKDRKTPIMTFEVDSRSGVNNTTHARVMIHRPKIHEWTCKVHLRINEKVLPEAFIRLLLSEGGEQIGIGSFRPEKGGSFGIFDVVSWEVVAPAMKSTPAREHAAA